MGGFMSRQKRILWQRTGRIAAVADSREACMLKQITVTELQRRHALFDPISRLVFFHGDHSGREGYLTPNFDENMPVEACGRRRHWYNPGWKSRCEASDCNPGASSMRNEPSNEGDTGRLRG